MLEDLFLSNFKSIDMSAPIALKNCSILCGSNSSGKSSLIQAILMLCQTFARRHQHDSVVLNGHMVRLGSFHDIKKHLSDSENITIKFSIPFTGDNSFRNSIKKVSCELVFGRKQKNKSKADDDFHPVVLSAKYELLSSGEEGEVIDYVHFRQPSTEQEIADDDGSLYIVDAFDFSDIDKTRAEYPGFKMLGAFKKGIVPRAFKIKYDYTKKLSANIVSMIIGEGPGRKKFRESHLEELEIKLPKLMFEKLKEIINRERENLISTTDVPLEILEAFQRDDQLKHLPNSTIKKHFVNATFALQPEDIQDGLFFDEEVELSDWKLFVQTLDMKRRKNLVDLLDKYRSEFQEAWYQGSKKIFKEENYTSRVFSIAGEMLNYYFSTSVKYLGPLRNEPQAVYASLGHIDTYTVGLKGEFTAAVLHINKDRVIEYSSPLAASGEFKSIQKSGTLKEACQEWLSYLGVIEDFHTRDKGKFGYELFVKTAQGEQWQDLTHVGVGVSQVLPIVLMFLLSTINDILIFEQPELHLHPKVQSRLCDLFLTMAADQRQCIIETHSEYLINRLRLRIAQDDEVTKIENSAVFFINKKNGTSVYEQISLNKYGSIVNWPEDFFDQTDREVENILIEGARKKRMEKSRHASSN